MLFVGVIFISPNKVVGRSFVGSSKAVGIP